MRFHISPDGTPRPCQALISCRFGDMETDHYSSVEQARQAFERGQASVPLPLGKKQLRGMAKDTSLSEAAALRMVREVEDADALFILARQTQNHRVLQALYERFKDADPTQTTFSTSRRVLENLARRNDLPPLLQRRMERRTLIHVDQLTDLYGSIPVPAVYLAGNGQASASFLHRLRWHPNTPYLVMGPLLANPAYAEVKDLKTMALNCSHYFSGCAVRNPNLNAEFHHEFLDHQRTGLGKTHEYQITYRELLKAQLSDSVLQRIIDEDSSHETQLSLVKYQCLPTDILDSFCASTVGTVREAALAQKNRVEKEARD